MCSNCSPNGQRTRLSTGHTTATFNGAVGADRIEVTDMLNLLAQRINRIRSQRKTISELYRMDDRMLADIGVVRGAISDAVRLGRV